MAPSSISGINLLPVTEKTKIYSQLIPAEILARFNLNLEQIVDGENHQLILNALDGSSTAELALYHQPGFRDPVLYGQITDTISLQVHILLYIINDPDSPRFDVDVLPDGDRTNFGTFSRNIAAETAAMEYGLAPGQIRRGLRMLSPALQSFESFISSLGHELYFAEPLYYHNAILFEWNGFSYQKGRQLMEDINTGFSKGGNLRGKLDGSTSFRMPGINESIRLRSWAIHDGILGYPFTNVTMYKYLGADAGVNTCPECTW